MNLTAAFDQAQAVSTENLDSMTGKWLEESARTSDVEATALLTSVLSGLPAGAVAMLLAFAIRRLAMAQEEKD